MHPVAIAERRTTIAHPTKIATCCHCGTKAMLKLDKGHHTLTCSTCGAPLRQMKALPCGDPAVQAATHRSPPRLRSLPHAKKRKETPPRKSRKRKSIWRKVASEAFDLIEDIFD